MIAYVTSAAQCEDIALDGFFGSWAVAPSEEQFMQMLYSTRHVVAAVDRDARRLAGFAVAHSDGVMFAHVAWLEVHPRYHGLGIGAELTERMQAALTRYCVVTFASVDVG